MAVEGLEDLFEGPQMPGISVEEASQSLGILVNTIREYLRKGRLKGFKVPSKFGPTWRADPNSVKKYKSTRRVGNPNYKLYPLTDRSQAALLTLSNRYGQGLTTKILRAANNKRMREARQRIIEALKLMIQDRQRISVNGLHRYSKCSHSTIRKHADIWRGYYGISPTSDYYGIPQC